MEKAKLNGRFNWPSDYHGYVLKIEDVIAAAISQPRTRIARFNRE